MPRPTIGETATTDAERQVRYRAARAAGKPVVRIRRPVDRRSLLERWNDTSAELSDLQARYAAWLESLPENLRDGATAEALRAIVDLDLSELRAVEPPRGFGRD
jgi:hypothetical protein